MESLHTLTVDRREVLRRINSFTVRTVREQSAGYRSLHDALQRGGRPTPTFSPGDGVHVFVLDGRPMWMKREVQVGAQRFADAAGPPPGADLRHAA
jgi:hypothetical protein